MTPNEMRRRAARLRAEAEDLVVAAGRLRVIAGEIRPLLDGVAARSRQVWQGPAADAFETRATDADATLGRQADLLTDQAAAFTREAAQLRATAAALEREADRLEAAAAASTATAPTGTAGGGGVTVR